MELLCLFSLTEPLKGILELGGNFNKLQNRLESSLSLPCAFIFIGSKRGAKSTCLIFQITIGSDQVCHVNKKH